MGKYKRKTDRKLVFTSKMLEDARTRIANGESKRQVAKSLGILESTLRNRLKQVNTSVFFPEKLILLLEPVLE